MSLKISKIKIILPIDPVVNLNLNLNNYKVDNEIKFIVIMSTYHRKNGKTLPYITRAINSIKNQTYKNWDIILVSDQYDPPEEFEEILRLFDGLPNQVYPLYNDDVARNHLSNKVKLWMIAAAGSINMGLNYARSLGYKYYARLDDDDYWGENHLLNANKMFTAFPNCIMTYSKTRFHKNAFIPSKIVSLKKNNLPPISGNVAHPSVCIRIDIIDFNYFTSFNEDEITIATDALMWSKIREFIQKNPEYCTVYIPVVSCFHETEREAISQ